MMYMGSKNRHAKDILPIILKDRGDSQWYVEPFAGGFNVIDKVQGSRIASDINKYLISLFTAIRDGWEPPSRISEAEYIDVKNNKENFPPELVGFIGFGCSYSGKFFRGYARGSNNKGVSRNYALESKKNILKQKPGIEGLNIVNRGYDRLTIPGKSVIYCDPPYAGTTKYKDSFDSKKFWDWVRIQVHEGHDVFISEYNAPDDFVAIWEKMVNNTLVKQTGSKKGTEKLFVYKG